jgi:predicted nuclease of predicted toxin-antitoxin system
VNIVADESVNRQIVERLRLDGHDVLSIAELDPGIDDDSVLHKSREVSAVLVTADKDFGELVFPAKGSLGSNAHSARGPEA